jgi:hypothetical protein
VRATRQMAPTVMTTTTRVPTHMALGCDSMRSLPSHVRPRVVLMQSSQPGCIACPPLLRLRRSRSRRRRRRRQGRTRATSLWHRRGSPPNGPPLRDSRFPLLFSQRAAIHTTPPSRTDQYIPHCLLGREIIFA